MNVMTIDHYGDNVKQGYFDQISLANQLPWNGAISISGAISIIYKFYNCNCLKNKNYKIKSPFQFLSLWYIYKVIITFKLSFRIIFRLINKSEYKSEVYSDLYYFFLWPQLKIQIWKPKERERSCTLRF